MVTIVALYIMVGEVVKGNFTSVQNSETNPVRQGARNGDNLLKSPKPKLNLNAKKGKKTSIWNRGPAYRGGCDLTNIDTNPRRAPRITKAPPSPPETIPSTNSTIAHTKVPTIFDPITQITPITIATILYIAPVK